MLPPLAGRDGEGVIKIALIKMHSASPSDIDRARRLRANMTDAELALWLRLRGEQIDGYRFRRQVPIGPYIVDFVCRKASLVIEVDGGQHASGGERDSERTAWLESRGYRVVRFWNTDILQEPDGVLAIIRGTLNAPSPDGAVAANGTGQ